MHHVWRGVVVVVSLMVLILNPVGIESPGFRIVDPVGFALDLIAFALIGFVLLSYWRALWTKR